MLSHPNATIALEMVGDIVNVVELIIKIERAKERERKTEISRKREVRRRVEATILWSVVERKKKSWTTDDIISTFGPPSAVSRV